MSRFNPKEGIINVAQVMREARQEAWEREKAAIVWKEHIRRMALLEEHEALRWYAKAVTEEDREDVRAKYGHALERNKLRRQGKLLY